MSEINYLLFISTSIIINAIPGPDVVFVISNYKYRGWIAATLSIVGLALGYLFHVIITYIGVSAIIASTPLLFNALKYLGCIYLIWLGGSIVLDAFNSKKGIARKNPVASTEKWKYLTQGLLTSVLNPKVGIFFSHLYPSSYRSHQTVK
ncbi:LysE family translocator [Microbulbifer sp. VAAF005]|uniref:LysE family translocator n=1 Tax=Microbulbifer sp. VAAF005 TaxID=3034230 RepID=UPI0024AD51A2|nr:LysE family translocator [Microbulbifer sp. VAAF005]WHI45915.1 LysE family translocator [Microbulbifer sp. VAAF005]